MQEICIYEKTLIRLLSGCPSLKRLTINSDGSTITDIGNFTIVDLFECLPVIEYLSIWFYIVMFFGPDRLPKELPTTMVHLKYLCMIHICFHHEYGLRFLALLIRSSPNLEKIKLVILEDMLFEIIVTGSYTIKDFSNIKFEHLKELEILNFSNEENELEFVKLMLAKSPVLKELKICFLSDALDKEVELEISKIILTSHCASPVVKKTIVRG
ncbi:F-box/FBD/LRR-repeat protein At1g13570-like [Bidens hawaiensis]|uniref:F-box/FBD/LRR-repeat protein At1g13570-like n=1 Tax=Bidens hawaiensis TaxID=980011 RepID=UPI00404AB8EC